MTATSGADRPVATPRVLHIITELQLGGAQALVMNIAKSLNGRGFVQSIATGAKGYWLHLASSYCSLYIVRGLRREWSPLADVTAIVDICKICREFKPHIVHTHTPKAGLLGRLAATLSGTKVVVHTLHGLGLNVRGSLTRLERTYLIAERRAKWLADRTVCVSEELRRTCVDSGVILPHRSVVIPGGIDICRFQFRYPTGPAAKATPIVGTVSSLKRGKGVVGFVRTCGIVRDEKENVRFQIAGDGPERMSVLSEIESLGLQQSVDLLGWYSDVPNLLRRFSVYLQMSEHEGLGLSVVEAMACGVPVVAADTDGTRELIDHGVSGFLVPQSDYSAAGSFVLDILNDQQLALRLARAARVTAECYSIGAMVDRYEKLYRTLL